MAERTVGQDEENDRAFEHDWLKAAKGCYIGSPPPAHRTDLWMVGLARKLWDAGMRRGEEKKGCCQEPRHA